MSITNSDSATTPTPDQQAQLYSLFNARNRFAFFGNDGDDE